MPLRRGHRPRPRRPGRRDRGITLLELAVAVAVLSIGTLAALRATDQSRLELGQARSRVLAQLAAENQAEAMRAFGPQGQPTAIGAISVEVALQPTAGNLLEATIRANAPDGTGALLVAILPGTGAR